MTWAIPITLSMNGGYVDTAGFLALQGLFTAHVTGNFVTFGASMVLGTSGAMAKLLALPVFCAAVLLVRLVGALLVHLRLPVLGTLLSLKIILLCAAAALALQFGPFNNGDNARAIATGMALVTAMAIQNAIHRIHLGTAPPTTLMTGSTTQVMIDLADLLLVGAPDARAGIRSRLLRMTASVCAFAAGCGAAAAMFAFFGMLCFLVPPAIGVAALAVHAAAPEAPAV
jgi:uncharacterized membrane protein YoaK (UPF0700 family)